MRTMHLLMATAAVLGLGALSALPVGAHTRDYANANVFLTTCNDDQESLGVGGAVGGAIKTAMGTADPLTPDQGGTCYRPNHILPNANGDVTISVVDTAITNVGLCVSQDSDGDGGYCNDDDDFQIRGCNAVTVNENFPVAGAWRFVDKPGFPARTTLVAVSFFTESSALIGANPDCGEGVDAFGTAGNVGHS